MKLPLAFAALLLLGVLLPISGAAKALDEDVDIVDGSDLESWRYSPTVLTISVGTSVTWNNDGAQVHSVTSRDQLFDSRLLDPGKSWSFTFEAPGTYRYFCVPHPWMKGAVVVTAAEEPTPRPTSTPTPSPSPSTTNASP